MSSFLATIPVSIGGERLHHRSECEECLSRSHADDQGPGPFPEPRVARVEHEDQHALEEADVPKNDEHSSEAIDF